MMMKKMEYWIEHLEMDAHVEGGWYKQTYQSDVMVGDRTTASSIYFLLSEKNFSAFHRLTADEIWYYHYGHTLTIVAIDLEGRLHEWKLGSNIDKGEQLQVLVPKGWIFGSYVFHGYGLVSCMVTPGFTFDDFELFRRKELIAEYPEHEKIIREMTRS